MMTDTPTNAQAAALFVVLMVITLIFTFVYLVPIIITMWKLYKKAGQRGWASIIPVYGDLVMARIGGKPPWMGWVAGLLPFVALVTANPIRGLVDLVELVFIIILLVGMAKKYDRGVGFWLVLVFLPIVSIFLVKHTNYIGAGPAQPASSDPTGPDGPAVPPATTTQAPTMAVPPQQGSTEGTPATPPPPPPTVG